MSSDELLNIRKLNERFSFTLIQMHEAIGRSAGLAGTDHKYLGFLIQNGQMTAGELAILSGLTTGAVTGLVDRFEKKGLVQRKHSLDDRRKVIIIPDKAKIMNLFAPLYKDYRQNIEEMIGSFSSEELKTIETFLLKSLQVMNGILSSHRNQT